MTNLSASASYDEEYEKLLNQEFNLIIPGNDFKMNRIHPEQNTFEFSGTDYLVDYAQFNNLDIHGHTLVWGNSSSLPDWIKNKTWTRTTLISAMENHINTIVSRYRGRVQAWDVVNEAFCSFDETQNCRGATNTLGGMDPSIFRNVIGEDFIEIALRAARNADPDVQIYVNENNNELVDTAKSNAFFQHIQSLILRGVPINGVGMQMHLNLGSLPSEYNTFDEFIASVKPKVIDNFKRFNDLGISVRITELDVSIPDNLYGPDMLDWQAKTFAMMLDVCLHATSCPSVNVWGFTDKYSWIPNAKPGIGHATPFDEFFQIKPAYTSLRNVLLNN